MIKAFKIPKWHELYSEYFRYLENTKDTIRILTDFRKRHKIKCELVLAGVDERTQKPYIMIGTHKDVKRVVADKKRFGTDLLKPNLRGMYSFRKNGKVYQDWLETLKKEDNFKILAEPKILDYIAFDNDGKDLGEFEKEYLVYDKDLYMLITSEKDFVVDEDFIEIEGYKFYDMKEEIEGGDN